MFHENLKNLRKEKGLSQEALADRIHVVRQTVSKWEKGASVPDAELLIRLAEALDTTVTELLGEPVEASSEKNAVSRQLEQLNAVLAERNRRSRRIWWIVATILIALAVLWVVSLILAQVFMFHTQEDVTVISKVVMEESAGVSYVG